MSFSPAIDPQSLEDLLALASKRFPLCFEAITVGGTQLQIPQLADMEGYLENLASQASADQPLELPFWARIWPTSIPLSHYLQRLTPSADDTLLEIGSGVGVCGLFAAKQGFQVTISDFNENAVLFCQIAIQKNNLDNQAKAIQLDFTKDNLPQKYPYIIGSEVLYIEDSFSPLVNFLIAHIDPHPKSEILLIKEYSRQADQFLAMAEPFFHIQTLTIGMRSAPNQDTQDTERHLCQILRLKLKQTCSS